MKKAELEQQLREADDAQGKLIGERYQLGCRIASLEIDAKGTDVALEQCGRSLARVREAIETVVATRWPDVDLHVTAYEVTMDIESNHPNNMHPRTSNMHPREYAAQWNERNTTQETECTELSLLRHLHRLAH